MTNKNFDSKHLGSIKDSLPLSLKLFIFMILVGVMYMVNILCESENSGWFGVLSTEDKYVLAKNQMFRIVDDLRKYEAKTPILPAKINCVLMKREVTSIFPKELFSGKKQLDPWGGTYRYIGTNAILISKGPDGYMQDNNSAFIPKLEKDDYYVSFEPVFYIKDVLIDSEKRVINFSFNKPLQKIRANVKPFVRLFSGKDKSSIGISKIEVTNILKTGILSIYVTRDLGEINEIQCDFTRTEDIVAEDGSQYPSPYIKFKDLRYGDLKGEWGGWQQKKISKKLTFGKCLDLY